METLYAFCDCFNQIEVRDATKRLLKEIGGFLWNPSLTEASDVCFAAGRLLGTLAGRKYVNVPGDSLTIEMMRERMMSYGCILSEDQLYLGKCPSLKA